jgi:hypothetical protein
MMDFERMIKHKVPSTVHPMHSHDTICSVCEEYKQKNYRIFKTIDDRSIIASINTFNNARKMYYRLIFDHTIFVEYTMIEFKSITNSLVDNEIYLDSICAILTFASDYGNTDYLNFILKFIRKQEIMIILVNNAKFVNFVAQSAPEKIKNILIVYIIDAFSVANECSIEINTAGFVPEFIKFVKFGVSRLAYSWVITNSMPNSNEILPYIANKLYHDMSDILVFDMELLGILNYEYTMKLLEMCTDENILNNTVNALAKCVIDITPDNSTIDITEFSKLTRNNIKNMAFS